MRVSLPKCYSIIVVFIQNISAYVADLHLKVTIATLHLATQLQVGAPVDNNNEYYTTSKRATFQVTELVKNQQNRIYIPLSISTTELCDKKESSNNLHYSAVRNFLNLVASEKNRGNQHKERVPRLSRQHSHSPTYCRPFYSFTGCSIRRYTLSAWLDSVPECKQRHLDRRHTMPLPLLRRARDLPQC